MRWKGSSHDPGRRRVHFPRIVKNKLLKAQRDKCAYCGQTHHSRYLRIDHKYPFSRGGSDEIDNLQLLCNPCNMRKGILSDEEFRHRYQRLLPDGSIPSSPIPQALFTEETQRTNNPQNVRAIYNARFTAARERQHAPHAGQSASRTGQHASHAGQPASRTGQSASRTGQHAPYAGQPASRTGQRAPHAGQPASRTGQHAPHAGQPASRTGQPASRTGQRARHAEAFRGYGVLAVVVLLALLASVLLSLLS